LLALFIQASNNCMKIIHSGGIVMVVKKVGKFDKGTLFCGWHGPAIANPKTMN